MMYARGGLEVFSGAAAKINRLTDEIKAERLRWKGRGCRLLSSVRGEEETATTEPGRGRGRRLGG
jgi:hypothetical protein